MVDAEILDSPAIIITLSLLFLSIQWKTASESWELVIGGRRGWITQVDNPAGTPAYMRRKSFTCDRIGCLKPNQTNEHDTIIYTQSVIQN